MCVINAIKTFKDSDSEWDIEEHIEKLSSRKVLYSIRVAFRISGIDKYLGDKPSVILRNIFPANECKSLFIWVSPSEIDESQIKDMQRHTVDAFDEIINKHGDNFKKDILLNRYMAFFASEA